MAGHGLADAKVCYFKPELTLSLENCEEGQHAAWLPAQPRPFHYSSLYPTDKETLVLEGEHTRVQNASKDGLEQDQETAFLQPSLGNFAPGRILSTVLSPCNKSREKLGGRESSSQKLSPSIQRPQIYRRELDQ